ncbi:MAG: LysM peptidoglycan-binding domain-containing protein [Oscillospiraceae bacterium]|nr:LysM peptidoglycan-binding domain-containing protein [Oscillospiraceae bacterium]
MTIHTVKAGETLLRIGAMYGVTARQLAIWNALGIDTALAVGQNLLVLTPAQTYIVQQGDTLNSIAGRFSLSTLTLLRNNPDLHGQTQIAPGQELILSYAEEPTREISAHGYAYPSVGDVTIRSLLPDATMLMPFTYGIGADGSLVVPDDQALIAKAYEYNVLPYMSLSTLTEEGGFSTERAIPLFNDPALRERFIANVTSQMENRGYQGLDLDFEYLDPAYRQAYADFVGSLRSAVNARGYELIVALAPKTSADQPGLLYEAHDYAAIGANSDRVMLMTYEWGYTYGPPMAVAPLASVKRVLDYAVTAIAPEKIIMGFPNYGYDWTLPFVQGTSRAQLISSETAPQRAVRNNAEIQFDQTAQTPYFNYRDAQGLMHEVWYEDPRSAIAKYRLIDTYGLSGIGFWNYMRQFTAGFLSLHRMYSIRNVGQE